MRRPNLAGLEQRIGRPAAMLTCAVAVLIWLKLRLVTGVPRSVYAEPGLPSPEQSAKERTLWLSTYARPQPETTEIQDPEQPMRKLSPAGEFE